MQMKISILGLEQGFGTRVYGRGGYRNTGLQRRRYSLCVLGPRTSIYLEASIQEYQELSEPRRIISRIPKFLSPHRPRNTYQTWGSGGSPAGNTRQILKGQDGRRTRERKGLLRSEREIAINLKGLGHIVPKGASHAES